MAFFNKLYSGTLGQVYRLYRRIEGVARVVREQDINPPFTMAQLLFIASYDELVNDLQQFMRLNFGFIPIGVELVESDDEGYSSDT